MDDRQTEPTLRVHPRPQSVDPQELAGHAVVVIDLLRATTTICHALAAGAVEVTPFLEVPDAVAAAESAGRADVLLGGERGGRPIPGFDLGNSPAEYTPEAVAGSRVFLTTTNGTRALFHARLAERVLIGALVNLSALAESLRGRPAVDILCAGTGGEVTREDILAAGALVAALCGETNVDWQTDDSADEARRDWEQVAAGAAAAGSPLEEHVARELRDTPGGRNLAEIGMESDLAACARIDLLRIVPRLDVPEWRIVAS